MEYLEDLALEVRISWGNSVLRVAHLSPPRSFVLGVADSAGKSDACDYVLPFDEYDGESVELVHVEEDGQSVSVCGFGDEEPIELSRGGQVVREMRGLRFVVELSRKTKPLPKGVLAINDWAPAGYLALSLTTFGSLMGALAFAVPPIGLDDDSVPDMQRRLVMQHYLNAAAEREQERVEEQHASDDGAPTGGNAGERAAGDEGQIGKEKSLSKNGRLSISGGSVTTPRRLSRNELITAAKDFGMIGMLKSLSEQDLDTPMHAFARDKALGPDDAMAHGNLWSPDIGEAAGSGGLSLSGIGFGGGALQGDSGSIGIGPGGLGGMGFCRPPNPCKGGPGGWSASAGRLGGGHHVKSPVMRTGEPQVSGRIPPEVIRRIVRQNFGRFRMCYEQGLARNPSLEGRVSVRFVIGRDGAVNTASASSDLSDSGVTSCVQAAFYGLSFPRPEGGMVKVTYPLMFSPG